MRVFLAGEGEEIPLEALPDPTTSDTLTPIRIELDPVEGFDKRDFVSLGYTNYECWCIGAVGGRGGLSSSDITYDIDDSVSAVPTSVWNLQLELKAIEDYWAQVNDWSFDPDPTRYQPPQYGRVYHAGSDTTWPSDTTKLVPGFVRWLWIVTEEFGFYPPNSMSPPVYWVNRGVTGITYAQAYELSNPSHQMAFQTVRRANLVSTNEGLGGAGGGGGLHHVSGLLADLPDISPIVVGEAGLDSGMGQIHQSGVWTPDGGVPASNPTPPASPLNSSSTATQVANRENVVRPYLANYVKTYPTPRTSFANPAAGQDGGASSFGSVCRASGGKGGGPSMKFVGSTLSFDAKGGDGGIGDSVTAGGGAVGSSSDANGADGSWDGIIGSGGGGGRGGHQAKTTVPTYPVQQASSGGQGSYSFADTSVFGNRGVRSSLSPGGGGGAKIGTLKYGGSAVGWSTRGAVIIRLTKIV